MPQVFFERWGGLVSLEVYGCSCSCMRGIVTVFLVMSDVYGLMVDPSTPPGVQELYLQN
jgi:hypothetical protein